MAFNFNNNSDELPEQSEINVTPFIDVMLVLLIIFMVAAPLATVSVPVNLPSSSSTKSTPSKDPVYLTVQQDMTLTLGESTTVSITELSHTLIAQDIDKDQAIFLRADEKIDYGQLMSVIDALGQAGYSKIALVNLEKAS